MRQITVKAGFTLVELLVIIVALSMITGVSVFGYGAWRQRVAETEVKSDLSNAAASMNTYRNFNNAFPVTGLPADFQSSQNVTITRTGNTTVFCIQGVSKVRSNVSFYVNSTNRKDPISGTC